MSELESQLPLLNDSERSIMKRILILGSGGAGKSTLARQLGSILKIDVIHLDALYWNPGWVEAPKTEWEQRLNVVLNQDSWIIDGNYTSTLESRLLRADTIVFLDISRYRCLMRIVKRRIQYCGRTRPDMARGCREQADWQFIKWVWNYPSQSRPAILKIINKHSIGKLIRILRTSSDVKHFIQYVQTLNV